MQKLNIPTLLLVLPILAIICSAEEVKSPRDNLEEILQQQQAELAHNVRHFQRQQYAVQLANALSGPGFPWFSQIQKNIMAECEMSMIEGIFHDALTEVFYEQPLGDLSLKLWKIYVHNYMFAKSYETMVRSQLILFSLYKMYQRIDYRYLIQTAYILQKIKHYPLYANDYNKLDPLLKQRMDNVIKDLPSSLQNLFFEPTFCLVNEKNQQMLNNSMEPIKKGSLEMYALTQNYTSSQHNLTNSIMETSLIDYDNGNITDMHLLLFSSPRNYLYIKAKDQAFLVATEKTYANPDHNLWLVDLVDENSLVFTSQLNGGRMCLADPKKNFVHVLNVTKPEEKKECQWKVIKCLKARK